MAPLSDRILVYSPNVALGRALSEALLVETPDLDLQLDDSYPTDAAIDACDQSGLGAVVVGTTDGGDGLRVVKTFRALAPEIPIVGIGESESSETLLAAMRAGASDFLRPPFSRDTLENLLASLSGGKGRAGAGRQICFSPSQSTDGASTIALHVAHAMPSLTNGKLILLDCDIHSSTLAFRLGRKFDFSIGDALERIADIDDLWQRMSTEWNGFRLLPCPSDGQPPTEAQRRRLPDIVASATHKFDTVIADLPSSLSPTAAEIARRSDTLYLVCTPYLVSIHLARRRLNQLRALGVDTDKVRLLVNRFDSKNAVSKSTIEGAIGLPVDFSLPNEFETVKQAAIKGGLIAPTSQLYKSLEKLAGHILGVVPAQKEQASSWKRLLNMG